MKIGKTAHVGKRIEIFHENFVECFAVKKYFSLIIFINILVHIDGECIDNRCVKFEEDRLSGF